MDIDFIFFALSARGALLPASVDRLSEAVGWDPVARTVYIAFLWNGAGDPVRTNKLCEHRWYDELPFNTVAAS